MKKNLKEIVVICLTAGLFCISAQSEPLELALEETQEISMGDCRHPAGTGKEDCKIKDKSCVTKKEKEGSRKGAAKRAVDGS